MAAFVSHAQVPEPTSFFAPHPPVSPLCVYSSRTQSASAIKCTARWRYDTPRDSAKKCTMLCTSCPWNTTCPCSVQQMTGPSCVVPPAWVSLSPFLSYLAGPPSTGDVSRACGLSSLVHLVGTRTWISRGSPRLRSDIRLCIRK